MIRATTRTIARRFLKFFDRSEIGYGDFLYVESGSPSAPSPRHFAHLYDRVEYSFWHGLPYYNGITVIGPRNWNALYDGEFRVPADSHHAPRRKSRTSSCRSASSRAADICRPALGQFKSVVAAI